VRLAKNIVVIVTNHSLVFLNQALQIKGAGCRGAKVWKRKRG